jgi:hypothetical protein
MDPLEKKEREKEREKARGEGGGERGKLSWSERDKARNRSSHVEKDRRPPAEHSPRAGVAYNKYKSELNKLFDSGGLADKFRDDLAADDPHVKAGGPVQEQRVLKKAEGQEFRKLLEGYVKTHGLPDDLEVLVRATTCNDPVLVKQVLRVITARCAEERIPGKAALLERLRMKVLESGDEELEGLVEGLKKALGH